MNVEAESYLSQAGRTWGSHRETSMNGARNHPDVARKVARINGRILLYAMTPLLLLGPILARDGQPWHFLVSIPLAIGNVLLCRWVIAWGKRGYVSLVGGEQQLWSEAMRHVPISFRWFGRTLTVAEIDAELGEMPDWLNARREYQAGDKIWPFTINPGTLAMRCGYVIVRRGRFVAGVVTLVS